jgi:hypothetical protein
MLQSTPPPQTAQEIAQKYPKPELVKEERLTEDQVKKSKEPFLKLKFKGGCLDFSAGKDIDVQNDATLRIGNIASVNSWTDTALFGSLYEEIKISLGPELPIKPVVGADMQYGEKTVFRGGLSTGFVESESVRLAIDRYFTSNKKDDDGETNKFWWLRGSLGPYDLGPLGDGWMIGGMTRLFSDEKTGVNVWASKDLGKGWGAKVQYWKTPAQKTRIYVTVFKKYGRR